MKSTAWLLKDKAFHISRGKNSNPTIYEVLQECSHCSSYDILPSIKCTHF